MEQRSIKILKLMEAIQERPKQSQRDLAETLDLSLGLVNKLINELSSMGILEPADRGRNKVEYTLTPRGTEWRADLNRQKILHQIDSYNEIKEVVEQGLRQLKDLPNNCCILLYGAGALCEIACLLLHKNKSCSIKIIDDKRAGRTVNGYTIHKEAEMNDMNYDGVIIMELDKNNSIRNKLSEKGISLKKIFSVFPQGF